MAVVPRWSGREARALREAKRMSVRDFAAHLGVNDAAVSNWERRGDQARLRYQTQQMLDTDLARASGEVRERFDLILLASRAVPAAEGRRRSRVDGAVGAPVAGIKRADSGQHGNLSPALAASGKAGEASTGGPFGPLGVLEQVSGRLGETWALTVSSGRFFGGSKIDAVACAAVDEGRILAAVPAGLVDDPFLWRATRGLLICVVDGPAGGRSYGLDTRPARGLLTKAATGARLMVPRAYALDDLTVGLIWVVANLDDSLLGDDALLARHRDRLTGYESFTRSSASRDDAHGLNPVSRMWLGSDFCARHILRHAEHLGDVPMFWTREQHGEEASSWLLFAHKYDYLRRVAARFGSTAGLTRAFCIPTDAVSGAPRFERIVLLLAAALMESFGVRVEVCRDPEYAGVEGFVLDQQRRAIVANWVGADGIWYVDVTERRPALRGYADIGGHARAHSVTAAPTASGRLRAFAGYLDLDWDWLIRRCAELGDAGVAGVAEPRSRLLSPAGVDRACRYLGGLDRPARP
jgi:hypothetical protein